jgi:hypothetical protein
MPTEKHQLVLELQTTNNFKKPNSKFKKHEGTKRIKVEISVLKKKEKIEKEEK